MAALKIAQNDDTADKVLQLPHVAWPWVGGQKGHRLGRQGQAAAVLCVESGQEGLGQGRDGFRPFAKRRYVKLYHVQPIVKILSEVAILQGAFEITVGGRNDADIRADQLASADPCEPEILQDMQELGLKQARHLANLIQAQSSATREFEPARLPAVGTRKGPFFVTKQLGLEQLGRKRRTVHQNERPRASFRHGVNGARNHVLPYPALTSNQYGRVGASDQADHVHQRLHRLAQDG